MAAWILAAVLLLYCGWACRRIWLRRKKKPVGCMGCPYKGTARCHGETGLRGGIDRRGAALRRRSVPRE